MNTPGLQRIDHVGVLVDDLADAERLLAGLGLRPAGTLAPEGMAIAFYDCNGTRIEAIELTDEAARAERLGGAQARIDHIAFAVEDLDETLAALAALGVETGEPRLSAGRRTCWTLPQTSDGVVYQLLEVRD